MAGTLSSQLLSAPGQLCLQKVTNTFPYSSAGPACLCLRRRRGRRPHWAAAHRRCLQHLEDCTCMCACSYFPWASFPPPQRCSPFAPVKEAKRAPPVPWFEQTVSQSTTPPKSQELFPTPVRTDGKSPRSLSVETPPSSSKQNTSLTRCMSMAELNSPESEGEEQLIGDESRPYCLPIVKGARPESLKCISPETV